MANKSFAALTIFLLACCRLCAAATAPDAPSMLVVVISGYKSDPSAGQLDRSAPRGSGNSGMYQLVGDLQNAGFDALFFNWNGTGPGKFKENNPPGAMGIAGAIRGELSKRRFSRLILVGHSWGGHTMLEVAKELNSPPKAKVELAIGIDPSSFARGVRKNKLPANVAKMVYFHTRNTFTWGGWKDDPRVEEVDLGDPARGFMIEGGANYAAAFDLGAHNAVEWDERVHAEVVRRVWRVSRAVSSPPSIERRRAAPGGLPRRARGL